MTPQVPLGGALPLRCSAQSHYRRRMFFSRRTWIELTVAVVGLWVLAEVQNSDGWRATLFDVIWVVSLITFRLLVVFGVICWVVSRRARSA
jgi:hypothetical protein